MRNFNVMAAVAVALLAGGVAVAAEEQPAKPKTKKICRVEEDSGSRMAVRRICKIVGDEEPVRARPQQEAARQAEGAGQAD